MLENDKLMYSADSGKIKSIWNNIVSHLKNCKKFYILEKEKSECEPRLKYDRSIFLYYPFIYFIISQINWDQFE